MTTSPRSRTGDSCRKGIEKPCDFWHIAPPDRESGRCHLRHGRHNFDATDGGPREFADVALDSAGSFHGNLLHSGRFPAAVGFSMKSHGIVPSFLEFFQKLPQTHLPTLTVGVLTIGVMLAGKRWLPRCPAPLLAVVFAVALVYSMGLEGKGVAVVGKVPAGLPRLRWPEFDPLLPLWCGNSHR